MQNYTECVRENLYKKGKSTVSKGELKFNLTEEKKTEDPFLIFKV